jgi:hypothetical protein
MSSKEDFDYKLTINNHITQKIYLDDFIFAKRAARSFGSLLRRRLACIFHGVERKWEDKLPIPPLSSSCSL